eukprot:8991023-Lingulodinium_polyedra.AAC.1
MPGSGRTARALIFHAADRKGPSGSLWAFVKESFKYYMRWVGLGQRPMGLEEVQKRARDGM